LHILGYLMTQFDTRNGICGAALQKVQEMFPREVFETVVRTNVKLQSAPAFKKSIYEHAPNSHGSADYEALTDEVLDRLIVATPLRVVKEA
jgi:chromosome partitioning protein